MIERTLLYELQKKKLYLHYYRNVSQRQLQKKHKLKTKIQKPFAGNLLLDKCMHIRFVSSSHHVLICLHYVICLFVERK